MHRISKRFAATCALDEVSLQVVRGQVLGLIGENGAGKSTLMKVLSGAFPPDSGTMRLDGRVFRPQGPHDARCSGVAMIYQELNLAPELSVEDNIMLGQEARFLGVLRRKVQRERVRDALGLLGHSELDPRLIVGQLSVGDQQLVEIARALVSRAKVIVFDEPTSSLPHRDVEHLFRVIDRVRQSGLGIVYISHFLEEVRRVCNTYHVLRDGKNAGSGRLADVTDQQIVSLMVGRTVDRLFPRVPHEIGGPLVSLRQISGRRLPRDVNLELHRGEILGLAGLVGAGRTETLRCLYGLDTLQSGQIRVSGKPIRPTPRARMRAGMGFVSEDRKQEGLAQELSITDNVTLARLAPYSRWGWLRHERRRRRVVDFLDRLAVKCHSAGQRVRTLSGGNQQKVALARVLHQGAEILLLDEPTRGIDVGTKAEIYQLMGDMAAEGKAIVFVSSYLPELLAICDRVAVLRRGKIADIRAAADWSEEAMMTCAISGDVD
jgi:ribose transport system ATP-binding protein